MPDVSGGLWTKKTIKGEIPIARRGHHAMTTEGNMYIFGGRTHNDNDDTC